jgi:hypothetical protein
MNEGSLLPPVPGIVFLYLAGIEGGKVSWGALSDEFVGQASRLS